MKNIISLLGSTGSIGTQTLSVARLHNIRVRALAANQNVKLLEQQAREFGVEAVCIYDEKLYSDLKTRLADTDIRVLCGMDGLCEIATLEVDAVVNSVVGMVGLKPTIAAIKAKNDIALANKETLVAGGGIVKAMAEENGVEITPIDSEHSAIFQCLMGNSTNKISKIILTASGGPFFGYSRADLAGVTKADALKHPNWSMGSKITIDSATLMNKGLEFIEAMWLFDVKPEQIEVVVHRQSIVHSAVEYEDGSVIAQMGVPDMRIPIQFALTYDRRLFCESERLSLTKIGTLTFEDVDDDTFLCLKLARKAAQLGGNAGCIINSANEVAVRAFLGDKISFLQIGELVQGALENIKYIENPTLSQIFETEMNTHEFVDHALK